eukprot:scaffold12932_cov66-Skeletonema_marinoi.AAC.1
MADHDNADLFIHGEGFQVYNPVDDDFAEWPDPETNLYSSEELQRRRDAMQEQILFQRKLRDAENFCEHVDKNGDGVKVFDSEDHIDKSTVAEGTIRDPLPLENLDNCDDDDALAQAIAEQDLPPGVSAVEQQEMMMRLLTQQLRRGDWSNDETLSPALEQRLRDFQFAQRKRRETYGNERPYGILGLYDHLAGIRLDVEWAEDAAWRRGHKEPYLSWADFNKKHSKGWNEPWFTYILIIVCTGMLIASFGVNDWLMEPININPMIGPSANTLIKLGAKQTALIVNQGEWYRLFSPMFLHA